MEENSSSPENSKSFYVDMCIKYWIVIVFLIIPNIGQGEVGCSKSEELSVKFDNQNIENAKENCESNGYTLALVKHQSDLDKLIDFATNMIIPVYFWAGFKYSQKIMQFDSGNVLKASEYLLWDTMEPSAKGCGVLYIQPGKVRIKDCNYHINFHCQRNKEEVCDRRQGYYKQKEYCLKVHTEKMSYENAKLACGNHSYLAEVTDDEIVEAMKREILLSKYGDGVWLGLRKLNGVWIHTDGTKVTENNIWAEGEPSNGECAAFSLRRNKKVISMDCAEEHYYACQKSGNQESYRSISAMHVPVFSRKCMPF